MYGFQSDKLMNTSIKKSARKKCFISAPIGTDLTVLRQALKVRNVEVLQPHDLAAGSDWATETRAQILQASLVVGVLSGNYASSWVLFELGQAAALERQILLIAPPSVESVPFSLHQMLVLRIEPDNEEAIVFALDQLLSAPDKTSKALSVQPKPLVGLGSKVDQLLVSLDQSLSSRESKAVEKVVSDILYASGSDVVVTSPNSEFGADFAVWSDLLESFVGNPLLVEVKVQINSKETALRAGKQLAAHISASGTLWGLLLYGDGPDVEGEWWEYMPPNVMVYPIRLFLSELRTRAFAEIVRDLRNRRIHGPLA
jgi:hypothetical protein